MNILFIASMPITSIDDCGIFPDLVREFTRNGHNVYAVSACERREKQPTHLLTEGNAYILQVRTLNNRRVSFFEKAIAVIVTPLLFGWAIRKYLKNLSIDLIIYSTPPITIYPLILSLKRKLRASTYLILKDIWPQAMVDLNIIDKGDFSWRFFEWLAKKLYSVSDYIGTMSERNSSLMLDLYPFIPKVKMEVCPNSAEPMGSDVLNGFADMRIREKFGIPNDAVLFSYGGSFNKPQGIPFLIKVLESYLNDDRVYFFLCGAGTDYYIVEEWYRNRQPRNVTLLPFLSKSDYFKLLIGSDAGLVFLDPRFTVPNMPSRTLDYMQFSLPVIAAVDEHTDFRSIIEDGGFGLGSIAGELQDFRCNVERLLDKELRKDMGNAGRRFLEEHWSAARACDLILKHFSESER